MNNYNHLITEKKWQSFFEENKIFKTNNKNNNKKFYCLEMFPYPSGNIHMGHVRNYTLGDVIANFKRLNGYNVLHPMGWDAFGLPAENAAIQNNLHPKDWTLKNISSMKLQLKRLGLSIDWNKEVSTCDELYYKHQQVLFSLLFKKGIAYKKKSYVNWDPVDNTVLANEQVIDGKGWRSGAVVEKKELNQWFLNITKYSDELLKSLDSLNGWPEKVKLMQKNWIGKSAGCEIDFISDFKNTKIKIFTTRPDTIFGASFIAIAANHPFTENFKNERNFQDFKELALKNIGTESSMSQNEKLGFKTPFFVSHPFLNKKIPIYVANFILMDYGTGAIFGCPAHDQRDLEFAKKYNLEIIPVVSPNKSEIIKIKNEAYVEDGYIINSDFLNGLNVEEAKINIIRRIEEKKIGNSKTIYRLKDWGISRQRYWGCPIPILYREDGNVILVPEKDLPVELPKDIDFSKPGNCGQPTGYVSNNTDCDDSNNQINPNVTEIADNIDNDCDGLTDEGFALLTWYLDNDQDGFGGASSVQSVLSPGSNYILQGGDCDDAISAINPNAQETCDGIDNNCDGLTDNGLTFVTYFADLDGDTYGNINDSIVACTQPSGYVLNNSDCDDTNSAINPGATDIPINGIDEDCNGADAPLLPVNLGMYTFTATTDCATQDNAVSVQPQGATFSLFNGVGTTCAAGGGVFNRSGWNGLNTVELTQYNEFSIIAENCKKLNLDRVAFKFRPSASAGSPIWHLRSSIDNFTSDIDFGTGVNVNNAYLKDTVLLVNHNNFDQETFRFYITEMLGTTTTWRMDDVSLFGNIISVTPQLYFADFDGDGYGDAANDTLTCTQPTGFILDNSDCNDQNASVNPLTVWYFDNDGDQIGDSTQTFIGCSSPVGYVLAAGDCDDANPQISGPITYYADVDGDLFGDNSTAQSLCQNPGIGYVTVGGDCDDANPLINPNATEVCDGIDNDCDGVTDDGLVFAMYYVDADGDGFGDEATGVESCSQPQNTITTGGDCDDTNDQIYPGATEVCDGVDNDCDGSFDEGLTFITYYTDADNDGFGTGSTGLSFCEIPGPGFSTNNQDCDDNNGQINPNATDILDNGIDENCDGVDGILGISNELFVNFELIPNPAYDVAKVSISSSALIGNLVIQDMNGKTLSVEKLNGQTTLFINVNHLAPGIYLVMLTSSNGTITKRLVKN